MKTKDLVYVGVIALFGFLLLRKKPLNSLKQNQLPNGGVSSTDSIPNGGLSLGKNMDLPNLTPKPKDALSTENALNNSNVKPIIKEVNEPTKIVINELSTDFKPSGVSTIVPNPMDVIPTPFVPQLPVTFPVESTGGSITVPTPFVPQLPVNYPVEPIGVSIIEEPIFDNRIDYPIERPLTQRPAIIEQLQPVDYPITYPVDYSNDYLYPTESKLDSIMEQPVSSIPRYYGSPIEIPQPQRPTIIEQVKPVDYGSPIYYPNIKPIGSSMIEEPVFDNRTDYATEAYHTQRPVITEQTQPTDYRSPIYYSDAKSIGSSMIEDPFAYGEIYQER
ncbi:MAG: hypothetical protein QG594_526 [Bacteroidota bacterium]|nr:hypothetical protein [Bacteroidota bacterium]